MTFGRWQWEARWRRAVARYLTGQPRPEQPARPLRVVDDGRGGITRRQNGP